jgi:hypothetical protein
VEASSNFDTSGMVPNVDTGGRTSLMHFTINLRQSGMPRVLGTYGVVLMAAIPNMESINNYSILMKNECIY